MKQIELTYQSTGSDGPLRTNCWDPGQAAPKIPCNCVLIALIKVTWQDSAGVGWRDGEKRHTTVIE